MIFIIHFYVGRHLPFEEFFPGFIGGALRQTKAFAYAAGIGIYHERGFSGGIQHHAVGRLGAHALVRKKFGAQFLRSCRREPGAKTFWMVFEEARREFLQPAGLLPEIAAALNSALEPRQRTNGKFPG